MRACCVLAFLLAWPLAPIEGASIRYEQRSPGRIRLTLPAEMGSSWREVNLGRLQVRSRARQTAVAAEALPAAGSLDLAIESAGCSLVQIDIGPPSLKGKTGSWRRVSRCTKIVACGSRHRDDRRRSSALVTGKTGSRIEIRPLLNPAVLVPGSDLPVRLYWEGTAVQSHTVRATGPEGRELEATTDGVGIAFLRIPVEGRWTVHFSHRGAEAELIFDVL